MSPAENPLVRAGTILIGLLVLLAVAAPVLTRIHVLREPVQQDQNGLDEDGMPRPPGGPYLLGTDNLGRDVLSRVIHGTRVSLTIGVAAMLTATILGVTVGLIAGFYGRKLDLGLMRFTEMSMTIPGILLAVAFAGVMDGRIVHLHPSGLAWHFLDVELKRGMVSLFLIIGIVCWPGMVRVVRAQVLALKEREFVEAAKAIGCSDLRIIFRHILPNSLAPIIVAGTLGMAGAILTESALSFLGLGVQPPTPSWGNMLMDSQTYLLDAPWMAVIPGLFIVLSVLSLYFVGEALRERLNPKE